MPRTDSGAAPTRFRNSMMEGAWIGSKVARYVVATFFRPLDEQ